MYTLKRQRKEYEKRTMVYAQSTEILLTDIWSREGEDCFELGEYVVVSPVFEPDIPSPTHRLLPSLSRLAASHETLNSLRKHQLPL